MRNNMEAEKYSGQVPLMQLILTVSKLSNLFEFSVSLFANMLVREVVKVNVMFTKNTLRGCM